MSVLDDLLRQHRWQLDERRRYLEELEYLAERLRRDVQRLQREIEEETGAGRFLLDKGGEYPEFVRPLVERRNKLERSVTEIEGQIVTAHAAAAAAEQEVKIYELAWAQRTAAASPTARRTRRSRRDKRMTLPSLYSRLGS